MLQSVNNTLIEGLCDCLKRICVRIRGGGKHCVGIYHIFFSRDATEIKDDSDSYKVELLLR